VGGPDVSGGRTALPASASGAIEALPSLPRNADGPVFPAPWAARAFAFALAGHERGLFTWREWAEALGREIASGAPAEAAGDAESYWLHWLAALERLVEEKEAAGAGELAALREAWREAAEATPHGTPVELGAEPRRRG
jgi:nitrile hydratase accessory protein